MQSVLEPCVTENISDATMEQAKCLETLIPKLSRRLFAIAATDPAAGLPASQLKICLMLQNGDKCISEISEEMAVTVSAITQLADRLENAGLVQRIVDKEDRRIKRLRLTEHGKSILQARRELRVQRMAQALVLLSPEAATSLCDGLRGLTEAAYQVLPDMQNAMAELVKMLG